MSEKIPITLSDRRPIIVTEKDWPLIARADKHDGAVENQANRVWTIRVREASNGRRVVYGWLGRGNGGMPVNWRPISGGFLVEAIGGDKPNEEETIRAIRRVAGIIGDAALGDECMGNLPAEEV